MKYYRVVGWEDRFESSKSKAYNRKSQSYVPNKQGIGYMRIMREHDGAAIYGAWCAVIAYLSRQEATRRGILTDNGKTTGTPLDVESISMLTFVHEEIIGRMLDFCSSQVIAWLAVEWRTAPDKDTAGDSQGTLDIPTAGRPKGKKKNSIPSSAKTYKPHCPSPLPLPLPLPLPEEVRVSDFDKFWKVYPRKLSKQAAEKAWDRTKKTRPSIEILLAAVEAQKKTTEWKPENKRFIPHPATWLNAGGWDNEIESMNGGSSFGNSKNRVSGTLDISPESTDEFAVEARRQAAGRSK